MTASWMYPRTEHVFTDSYLIELEEKAATTPPKPKAADTIGRYSRTFTCARLVAYEQLGIKAGFRVDGAGEKAMQDGTGDHEHLQDAIVRRYPDAMLEVETAIEDLTSGRCDAYVPSLAAVWEFKNLPPFSVDQAVGIVRSGKNKGLVSPKGPKAPHIAQAGINALGLRAAGHRVERLFIGYQTKMAVSISLAEEIGLPMRHRSIAEWEVPEEVWLPLAERELQRLREMKVLLEAGSLPPRGEVDDAGKSITLDPDAAKPYKGSDPNWRCKGYCAFADQCRIDGPGMPDIPKLLSLAS